jgi:hypothetical protein
MINLGIQGACDEAMYQVIIFLINFKLLLLYSFKCLLSYSKSLRRVVELYNVAMDM